MTAFRQRLTSVAKWVLALGLLAIVLRNTELDKLYDYIKRLTWYELLAALLFINIAQYAAALRMRYYYHAVGHAMTRGFALALYYVGMFYNFVLPGGIGGDGYKVFLLKRRVGWPVGQGIKLMVANRANGFLILVLLFYVAALFIHFPLPLSFRAPILLMVGFFTIIIYFWLAERLFSETRRMAIHGIGYSLIVQLCTVIAMIVLWHALDHHESLAEYIALFLIASVLGILPISLGGLGIRELTFFYGADIFAKLTGVMLDKEFGVALSLIFFGLNLLSSLVGLPFLHRVSHMKVTEE